MDTDYQKIIEVIQHYCLVKDFDSLQAIIQLLTQHDFDNAEIQKLLGDVLFFFNNINEAKEIYKKSAYLYEKSEKKFESEAILLHLKNLPIIK